MRFTTDLAVPFDLRTTRAALSGLERALPLLGATREPGEPLVLGWGPVRVAYRLRPDAPAGPTAEVRVAATESDEPDGVAPAGAPVVVDLEAALRAAGRGLTSVELTTRLSIAGQPADERLLGMVQDAARAVGSVGNTVVSALPVGTRRAA